MGGDIDKFKASVQQGFQGVKQDMEALRIRLMLVEADQKRLQEEVRDLKAEARREKEARMLAEERLRISQSQASLKPEELRLTIKEILSEALIVKNSQAGSVFSPTETERFPEQITTLEPLQPQAHKERILENNRQANAKQQPPDGLKEELLRSYERQRKDLVKQHILAEIRQRDLSRMQLRKIVVDQKKYCSKASFYRYLENLEKEGIMTERKGRKGFVLVIQNVSV